MKPFIDTRSFIGIMLLVIVTTVMLWREYRVIEVTNYMSKRNVYLLILFTEILATAIAIIYLLA